MIWLRSWRSYNFPEFTYLLHPLIKAYPLKVATPQVECYSDRVNSLLQKLLTLPVQTAPNEINEWWPWLLSQWRSCDSLFEKAALGGIYAETLGLAFAASYQAALRSLFSTLPDDKLAALCATEAMGAHPKAIQTKLSVLEKQHLLSGHKTFVTLADHAKILFVVATTGEHLVVVQVTADAPGVQIIPMPPFSFVPEISHAEATFTEVALHEANLLPGDGYDLYLKPFRTIEDIFVHTACLGYLLRVARKYQWPGSAIEDILSLLLALAPLSTMIPSAPETHLVLAGVIRSTKRLIIELEPLWERCPEETRTGWQRDKKLLQVAERVRQQRTESAWKKMLLLTKL
jgi:acyl-CoA dehydrogenase